MAVYFFDSSALVKRYIAETGSGWVSGLTDPTAGNINFIAGITAVGDCLCCSPARSRRPPLKR
jgi:hypothetical protein